MARSFWLTKLLVQSGLAQFLPVARRLTDGGPEFLKYLSDAVLAAPVEELLDSAYFPVAGHDVLDLNLAAPRFESSVSLGRVTADRRGSPPAEGLPELRRAIAEQYLKRDGRAVDADREVFVTHGATGAYAAVLDTFVNPGDRVVLFDPSSPLFSLGGRSRRADVRWVPTSNERGCCRFDVKAFEHAMRRAKLLVLADPANPTGSCLGPEELAHIVRIAAKRDVLVYADESFGAFRDEGERRSLATLAGGESRVLTAGSVSQGWGLGSVRIGWLAGPRHLVKVCSLAANLHAPFVATLCQQVAVRALTSDSPVDSFREKRQYVVDCLRGLGFAPEWPVAGYFVWFPVTGVGLSGRTFAERLLKKHRVLVGPGCAFGPSGVHHVRISFATDDGRLREGLARLAAFVHELRGEPVVSEPEDAAIEHVAAEPVFSRA